MQQELTTFDETREELIKDSRVLQHLAKKGMYAVHRNDLGEAAKIFTEALPLVKKLIAQYTNNYKLKIGAVTAALEEWCECYAYYVYAKDGVLLQKEETGLETEDYLAAIGDLTGELTRKAITLAIDKDYAGVKKIRVFVDDILGQFLCFDFRNGELRKKTDQLRWNLQKIEELLVRQ